MQLPAYSTYANGHRRPVGSRAPPLALEHPKVAGTIKGWLSIWMGSQPCCCREPDRTTTTSGEHFPPPCDAGYRGEIKVALINLDPAAPIVVHRGDRIAQLLVQRVELVELVEVSSFDEAGLASTSRGDGGHGSSGGHASL